MKRRLLSAFLAVMMVLTMAPVAFAVNEGETTTETLQSKINAIQGTGTVTLDKDYNEDITIQANKDITLKLNGKTLTNNAGDTITVALGATLTIEGKGTVDNISHGKAAVYNNGLVTLNGGTYTRSQENGQSTESSGGNSYYNILNHGNMTINDGVEVLQNGHFSSLVANGYYNYTKTSAGAKTAYIEGTNVAEPILTINGGTFSGGINTLKNDDGGNITIKGGTVTNYTQAALQNHNVAMITGGTFTAGSKYSIDNCGCEATHDVGKLAIAGGEFKGTLYTHESNSVVTITDGKFDGKVLKTGGSISITGGLFTTDFDESYCADGWTIIGSEDSAYPYTVSKKNDDAKPAKVESTSVAPSVAENASDAAKEAAEDMHGGNINGEALKAATKTVASSNTIEANTTVEGNETVLEKLNKALPEGTTATKDTVKIVYQTYMDIEVTGAVEGEADENGDTTFTELTVDLTPMYRVIATNAENNYVVDGEADEDENVNAVQIGNAQKLNLPDGQYTVELQLPYGFAEADQKLSIKHSKTSGVEYYTGTVRIPSAQPIVTFTTNGFSPFTIYANVAAYIGDTAYPTLQAAADAAKSTDVISVKSGASHELNFTTTKSVKVKNATGADITVKFNGENKTVAKDATETFTYTKPSSGSSGGSSSGKTTYKVTTSAVNNGGVNASPSTAEKGATITITLSPDKGYTLGKLTVTDGSGKTVSTVKKSDTVYTFTMPASAVTVGVSYVKADETPSETGYSDVSANDWFASAVDYVTDKGMMNGTGTNTFGPKANTTRGMVVTVLYRLENEPSTAAASFTDVASGAYYANAVAWANANGIVSGYGNGKFGPNDKVTREQLAAILYRYAQYKKYDVSVGEDTNIMDFDDVRQISSYAVPAIQWACGAGVMSGKSTYTLDPKGDATRAEVAAMLMRFCENVK